jgi:hypothetical protein
MLRLIDAEQNETIPSYFPLPSALIHNNVFNGMELVLATRKQRAIRFITEQVMVQIVPGNLLVNIADRHNACAASQ